MKIIAIIPCKEHSERLQNKNILKINGKELYKYSIDYAIRNNMIPVVSTDSTYVINQCKQDGIDFYEESVNDSNMCNCIDQVLSKYDCDYFVLLQPTSPIRQDGIIKSITLPKTSIYTADKVKIIGHIGNHFNVCYRDQDESTKFLYHFDGNMVIVNTKWYKENHCLFNDDSTYITEDIPYTLQIDNLEQFKVIERLYKSL